MACAHSWLNGEKSTGWDWMELDRGTEGERKRAASAAVGCGCAVSVGPLGKRLGREWKIVLPRILGIL